MLLKGTRWEREGLSQQAGECFRKPWERGEPGQQVCTSGSGASTFEMCCYFLPRKLEGGVEGLSGGMESWKSTGF